MVAEIRTVAVIVAETETADEATETVVAAVKAKATADDTKINVKPGTFFEDRA
jgi:hypothetical protein